jgi:CHAP domain
MSVESTLGQVSAIRQALANPATLISSSAALSGGTEAPSPNAATTTSGEPSFAETLRLASSSLPVPVSLGAPGESAGARIVAIAESQLGQTEQPPGSNESPAIAQYRTATEGAIPGAPWCAYFASWVARQAGEPLGAQGQGVGDVSDIWSWAQSTGRAIPNGPGVLPKPGDLIVFGGEHVGIVRGILTNGQIATIEGNYENKVAANVRSPTEATGYVSMS